MKRVVSEQPTTEADARRRLVALYDDAMSEVYRYLRRRCDSAAVAEDLTSETFLAAAHAVRRGTVSELTVAWLVRVARNKLVDHWRRSERERRRLELVEIDEETDPWEARLDAVVARETLATLAPHHRGVLTLRYLDDLAVPQIAECLDRTVGATEVLLVRARRAFRAAYESTSGPGEEPR
jgi:RNA polymerase sigma-70 factor (ECF subfamily)